MKIKDSQIKAILAEVEQEVGALLKSESAKLAKAAGEDEAPAEETPGEAPASAPPGPDSASPEAPADESAAPAPDASPDASASPEMAPEGSQDPGAEAGPVDPEALKAEYSQLPPEELKVHFLACKAAMAEVFGASAGAEDGAGTPPPGPEGSAPMAPPAPEASAPMAPPAPQPGAVAPGQEVTPPAMKSEKEETDLAKAEVEDLKRQVELMTKAVTMVLGKPERKAVTGVAFLGKGEEAKPVPTKAEIQAKLSEVIKHPDLKKSDRERIVSYSYGNIGFEQIKDLLEKV